MADEPVKPSGHAGDDPLDDYFARLGEALGARDRDQPSAPSEAGGGDPVVPTLDAVLSPPMDSQGRSNPAPTSGAAVVAEAFAALLALEQGEPGARPVRLIAGPPEPVVTDALIDEITRRVLERLAPDTARDLVAQIVSEVSERLVREEIARIRGR